MCAPATLLSLLGTASAAMLTVAEQYGAGKITHDAFLHRRLHPTSIIAAADADLRRHLRARLLQQLPESVSAIDVLTVGRQRTIVDALVSTLVVQSGRSGRHFDFRIELHPRR